MSCCNRSRSPRHATSFRPAPPPARPPAPAADAVRLVYFGDAPLVVRGPESGVVYRVGPAARELRADPADVTTLLRTRLFGRTEP